MRDVARVVWLRPPPAWVGWLVGGAAGGLAALLLLLATPLMAALALAGLVGGALVLVAPHIGLYLITAVTIVSLPGGLIKYAGLGLTVSALLWALAHRRPILTRDGILATLALLTGLVWLSALTRGAEDSLSTATSYTGFLAYYWAVSTLADRPAVMTRMVGAMLLSGLAIAAIGFVQFRFPFIWVASTTAVDGATAFRTGTGTDLLSLQEWGGVFRVDSLTGTPDYLGLSMQILLPFAVMWTVGQRSLRGRAGGVAAVAALAGALILSFTRGVMVITAAVVVPFLAAKVGWRRALPWLVVGALLLAAGVSAWAPLRERAASTVTEWTGGDTNSPGGWRRAVLPIGGQIFLAYFWSGAGLGRQREVFQQYAPSTLVIPVDELQAPLHNAYLTIAIELGVGGLTCLVLLVVLAWRRLRQVQAHFRASNQAALLALANAAEVAWVGLAVSIAFYPHLATFRYFWILLAAVGGLSRVAADQQERARRGMVARG